MITYITEKEIKERLKQDSKSDLIGKLIMAYLTIRKMKEKNDELEGKQK